MDAMQKMKRVRLAEHEFARFDAAEALTPLQELTAEELNTASPPKPEKWWSNPNFARASPDVVHMHAHNQPSASADTLRRSSKSFPVSSRRSSPVNSPAKPSSKRDNAHQDVKHNCPCHDSTQPSQRIELLNAATDKAYANRVKLRVLVCHHSSPDCSPIDAFASFETDGRGINRLRLRCDQKVLAYIAVATLQPTYLNDLLVLTPRVVSKASPPLHLKFQDHVTQYMFSRMFLTSINP